QRPEYTTTLELVQRVLMMLLLFLILFAMGCTITLADVVVNLRRPYRLRRSDVTVRRAAAGGVRIRSSHAVATAQAIGMLVMACTPGGAMSNMFTYWTDGDIALSICITTVSTLVAIGMMPLNLFLYTRSWTDKRAVIPYGNLALALVIITVPVAMGMLLRWRRHLLAQSVSKVFSIVSLVGVACSLALQVVIFPQMFRAAWSVYVAAFTLSLLGLTFGFTLAAICRLSWPRCRTVSLETAVQNVPLCLTVIMLTFPREFANEALLFPCLYALASLLYPLTLVCVWNAYYYGRCRPGGKARAHERLPLDDVGAGRLADDNDDDKTLA
ncbi:PREDICTED: LOW QUALITY PROTEIN: solute carrier family 10 member 6-like, partial [Priapulus caudatus]|uniref:LOW QUALITY PROTEIN: solute carrier family 10 member 6-like n=1 Tax=Priapulus caudatus TaxID=37621 RepID=A0ABM1F1K8_PRICU